MRKDRAMVMIFVVIMMAAMSTILAASVDLGRMAVYKQKQLEREAKWKYCVDSAQALVTENLVNSGTYTQSFSQTVNGISLTISNELNSWSDPWGCRMTAKGTLDGKLKSSILYFGKRSTVQPCQFGMFFTSKVQPDTNASVTGDLYYAGTIDASSVKVTGDVYSPSTSAPNFSVFSGTFVGRQPGLKISLDDATYQSAADISTSGTSTLSNPTNLLSLSHSQLRYHEGNLTIKGTITGEITIFVKGSVTIQNTVQFTNILSRLVVICDGDITFSSGSSSVFAISNGRIQGDGGKSARLISGSIAGKELSNTGGNWTVTFDSYFSSFSGGGERYRIPGQW